MNRDLVLELIRMHQPISRAELSRLSGLQRSTISLIIEQLIGERWVREGDVARLPRGRRPTMLGLNRDLALLVADVHPGEATLAVVDLYGNLHARTRLEISAEPAKGIAQLAEELVRMRAAHPALTFEGVGISLPGRVDPHTQQLVFAPNLRWAGEPIKAQLEAALALPVELENAANAALLAELWLGKLQGVRDVVLVTIDEGIGTGVLANGQLVTGHNGMAGEFGHVALPGEGPRCACGQLGCWEVFASTGAALRYWAEAAGADERNAPTYPELIELVRAGDPAATAAFERQARAIGHGLRAVEAGLAPEVIVVAGIITDAWPLYRPIVEEELAARALGSTPVPRIAVTDDCGTTRLHGAAAIVLQRNSLFRVHG
jgi:predicted NBD/HSP70 family sugar kinase